MEQKSLGYNHSTLIRYWLPNKIFKVAVGCYPDVGSSTISISLKVEGKYIYNRLQLIKQLPIPYNKVWILSVTRCSQSSIEWDRTCLAITIQLRCDLHFQKNIQSLGLMLPQSCLLIDSHRFKTQKTRTTGSS